MTTSITPTPDADTQAILDSLRDAVASIRNPKRKRGPAFPAIGDDPRLRFGLR